MVCVGINEFGQVVEVAESACAYVLLKSDDFLASASLDAQSIAYSFAWGFGTVITLWALAYSVRAAITVIKKI